ncbi:MAG: S8 family serine peptidase [Sedimentibacter sp.]
MIIKNLLCLTALLILSNGTNIETSQNLNLDNRTDVVVAVIDSKIKAEHEFLKNSCLKGKKFVLDDKSEEYHGTAVAGSVLKYSQITAEELGRENNVKILPIEIDVRDIQTDGGYLLSSAIEYAVDSGADVINMSFSSSVPNINVYEKIRYGIEKGVIFVSAAGNSGIDTHSFPASYDGVISAGSCYVEGEKYFKSSFSNGNNDVDLLVAGEKMLLPDDASYSEKTGTSYSAGALSGIVGELISAYPELKPEHIVYALYDTAISVEGKGTGYGTADIQGAANYLDKLTEHKLSPASYDMLNKEIPRACIISDMDNISAGRSHAAYVLEGKIKLYGNGSDKIFTSKWENIAAVYAGKDNTAAVNIFGLPMASGYNVFNKNIFRGWKDIKELSLSPNFTAGLTENGYVLATDYLKDAGIENLTDIKQISSGAHHISALTSTGKVICKGYNLYNQMDTHEWSNIVYIAANTRNTAAVDSMGNVHVAGDNLYGQRNLDDWEDIVQVDVGDGFIVGLKKDGTVKAEGRNIYNVCETGDLKNIKYIDAADTYFIAIDRENNVYLMGKIR